MQRENTLTREIHNLLQGSDDWHAFRFNHHGASEAAAMLGLSKKVTRSELVRMKATGLAKEFSDWVQENILDYGHEVEALARPFAERIIGDDLYPATLSLGRESASCDGLNMAETIGFEHKQWNADLAASVRADVLPEEHQPQVQQQLLVTGAEKWLFMASDGTENNMVWMWVYPDTAWFARIVAGWEQFDIDVVNYTQVDIAEKPAAEPIAALPALVVQTEGKVVSSNLVAYKAAAEKFIAKINTKLETDEDFANAENTVKYCGEAEDKLELAKAAALAQTATIDEMMRTVDHIKAQFRAKRLELEKLVKTRKEQIKETILNEGRHAFTAHIAALETEITPLRLQQSQPDFAGAMKNKRTLGSLRDAVSTTLANAKIAANTQAADYRAKQAWCREHAATYGFLFMHMANIIGKPMEDFQLVITSRIADHKRAEEAKAEAERARIREEERVKAEKAAAETIRLAQVGSDRLAAEAAQAERERAAADTQRQLAEQASQIAAERAAEPSVQVVAPKPTTPIAARRAPTAAAPVPAPSRSAPAPDLLDAAADDLYPSDSDILDVLFEQFGLTPAEAIDRLDKFDFAAARAGLVAEAA
ncbi:YqaJ-like viral recombinase domain protein [Janthinobacterium sp. MP5059B]|uniref:YqaJ viral recombinase family protein n=1 Tax=Janthinobacterium sp. MP5059B TaxID=1766683 RepID=UPI000893A516|nr:YqaJ viral recombinase family protein [Janthinobacterium sp. MP5059B]OEZ50298.1 YqaJ-like viral recombinase domain protein [Janthinobacterium sp. MP5059B]